MTGKGGWTQSEKKKRRGGGGGGRQYRGLQKKGEVSTPLPTMCLQFYCKNFSIFQTFEI